MTISTYKSPIPSQHNYFEPWQIYRTHEVRQLAFAIASPNVVQNFPVEVEINRSIQFLADQDWYNFYQNYSHRLYALDQNPTELLEFLAKIKSTRLGIRFEALLWFWLQDPQNPDYELLGHSIQIFEGRKTLGEIDFLLQNKQNKMIEHWEVCLKYYLAQEHMHIGGWIGLNPEDTLAHKLSYLANKQFQFDEVSGFQIEKRIATMKGQFFLHPQDFKKMCVSLAQDINQPLFPTWLNYSRRLGYWQTEIPDHHSLRRLQRQEWLCPTAPPYNMQDQIQTISCWTNGLYMDAKQQKFIIFNSDQEHIFELLTANKN